MDRFVVPWAVITYIEANVQEKLSVLSQRLAALSGYSHAHLRALFVQSVGQPLHRYIQSRKVANAAFDLLYTNASVVELAFKYGYESHDVFTRAFRRFAGCTPSAFRKQRPAVSRVQLRPGVFAVDFHNRPNEQVAAMHSRKQTEHRPDSVVLYGVPKVEYGTYGASTPFPICLKAVANYLGEDIDYDEINVLGGEAFRLCWKKGAWSLGNVDVSNIYPQKNAVYPLHLRALGRRFEYMERTETSTKEAFAAFIRRHLDEGLPVIALGMVGPTEAGIVTGYRNGGETMLGWSFFQDKLEYGAGVTIDASGYYSTEGWWENGVDAVMVIGERVGPKDGLPQVLQRMRTVLEGFKQDGRARGLYAYDDWLADLADDTQFPENAVMQTLAERLLSHVDNLDMLLDGRHSAARYFRRLEGENPVFGEMADHFTAVFKKALAMYYYMDVPARSDAAVRALQKPETRRALCALLRQARDEDAAALRCLEKLSL